MAELSKTTIKNFIKDYRITLSVKTDREQLRCIVVAYCIVNNIDSTDKWNRLVDEIYAEFWGKTDWTRTQFNDFMREPLFK